ncbi:Bcr/CflA family multidrug efflux transporter [Actinobacillus delphinicola]|uniref:purine nucleoside transporter PunC n=1 Tax=Actinobacillus delphinicola TaxID=51161 RepID=UPI00244139F1|nr:purine nucleoside transporter PunC [Actinobacillus delphinicola]MDG6897459.1 Bcr/CflA family multidrug efflux transporter [Actinobacillus delphinicola]
MKGTPTKFTLFWFACLSMLGFLSTDMYLPAFETLRTAFGTTESSIGLTLSVFLLGMAIGQLVYGPLSDRIGRIKVLVGGMTLFGLATLLCAFSQDIQVFLGARFLQSLGACSATVIWQAIVVDRYEGQTAGRIFATIMPLVALSPALAPLVGAGLEHHFGWRSIFLVLVAFGIFIALMTLREPESAPLDREQEKLSVQLKRDYVAILTSKKFFGNMIIFAACSAAFFAYLTGSPFIMAAMGYTGGDIGLSYVPQTIAFIVGGFGCRSLLAHYEGKRILPWLLGLFFLSVLVMFIIPFVMPVNNIWPILIPFCFLAVANGAIYPIVINLALSDFKECSATAAGLLNFLQTLICFIASGLVSAFAMYGLWTVTVAMFVCGFITLFGFALFRQSQYEATAVAEA